MTIAEAAARAGPRLVCILPFCRAGPPARAHPPPRLTLNVNLEALITSMMLKAAQLMSYPNICNCRKDRHRRLQAHAEAGCPTPCPRPGAGLPEPTPWRQPSHLELHGQVHEGGGQVSAAQALASTHPGCLQVDESARAPPGSYRVPGCPQARWGPPHPRPQGPHSTPSLDGEKSALCAKARACLAGGRRWAGSG